MKPSLRRAKPVRRSLPKLPFLSLQMLEGRDVPAAIIVDPTYDGTTPGFGVTAFNTVSSALAVADTVDTVNVHPGDYSADLTPVVLSKALPLTFDAGATKIGEFAATAGNVVLDGDLSFGSANNTTIGVVISGTGGLIKLGTGQVTLSQANLYGGVTTVSGGRLIVTDASALGTVLAGTVVETGGTLEVATTAAIAEPLTITGDGDAVGVGALRNSTGATWSGAIGIGTGGARINSGASTFTISGAVGGSGNIEPITFGGNKDMAISGVISSALGGQANFDGGNVVTVSGSNSSSFLSAILISNGTEIRTPGSINLGGSAGAEMITFDNGTLTHTTTAGVPTFLSVNRTINLAAGGATLATSGTAFGIYAGRITGTGNLRLHKPGSTAILGFTDASNSTDYVGDTIIQGGTVRLRTNPEVFSPNGYLQIDAGGKFDFTVGGATQTFKGVNGTGTVLQSTSTGGTFKINGPSGATSSFGGSITSATIKWTLDALNEATQVITSANATTGVTTVNGGIFMPANSTGSALGTGTTTVTSPGILSTPDTSNDGIMGGALVMNNKLTPGGNNQGRLTVNNNVTFGAASEFHVDVRGTTAGFGTTGYDQLAVSGITTITDGAKLLLNFGSFIPSPGDAFRVIDNTGSNAITTKFRDANGVLLNQGTEFDIGGLLYRASYIGGDGNDLVITRILPTTTYYVRKDFNAGATDLDGVAPGIQVDGDPLNPNEPLATVGVNAFDTIMAAVNKSSVNGDKIIVGSDGISFTYAEQVDIGAKEILFTFQENPITVNSIKGTNTLSSIALGTKADLVTGILLTMGGDDLSVSLAASLSGPGGIIKIGNGALTLAPVANSYSGSTSIATAGGGSIVAGSTGAFSTISPFDLSATAHLILNGFNSTIGNLTGPAGSFVENTSSANDVILTAGSTKIADQSTDDLSFLGEILDGGIKSLGFIKVGGGILTLPPVNNFSGPFGLLGGSYTVDTLSNGGVAGPFGKSSNAATNFRIGGGKLVYTGAAIPAPGFDRNITWGATSTIDSANDVVFAGTITGSTATPGGFVKEGTGKFTFLAADAFQAPNTLTSYGNLGTGTITVNGGEIIAQNITVRGAIAARSTVNYVGTRNLVIGTGASVTIKNTLAFDPDGNSYVNQVQGAGTLIIDTASSSKSNPSIAFDAGPNVSKVGGGDVRPFGSAVTAQVTLVGSGTVFIVGKADRNDLNRHSGDLRFNGKITGSAPIQFIGLTSSDSGRNNDADASNVHFVLNADNSTTYTGGVSLANADLALTNDNALSAANSLTFNSVIDPNTQNRAALYLFGRSVTIGSLNDTSDTGTTSTIRNGSIDTANGGTGISSGNALGLQNDSTLTIMQTTNGTFKGDFSNGPIDNPEVANANSYKLLNIIKDGIGALTVTGNSPLANVKLSNPTAGIFAVNNGTLVYDGSITTKSNVINVASTASVGGSGSIQGLAVSGTLSGGTNGTVGILNTGNLSFGGSGTFVADLASPLSFDQIKVVGTVDLIGANLNVNLLGGYTPTIGTKFILIDNDDVDPISNTFVGLAEGDFFMAGGTKFQITYMGGDGNDAMAVAVPSGAASVTNFIINTGQGQRSRLTSITVTFNGSVSPGSFTNPGDMKLTRYVATPTGVVGTVVETGAVGANGLITVTQPGPSTELLLTFSNADSSNVTSGVEFGSLSDGRWELSIPSAGGYLSGQPLSPTPPNIHRLFGDFDGNATVDGSDFGFFPPFGAVIGDPFDYDNNNDVGGGDFGEFGNRFGLSL